MSLTSHSQNNHYYIFFLQISLHQTRCILIALYLCHAYVSVWNSGLIEVTSLAGSWLSRVLSMEKTCVLPQSFFYFPTKTDSSLLWGGGWGYHILACPKVVLPAFRASLTLSSSSSEKRIFSFFTCSWSIEYSITYCFLWYPFHMCCFGSRGGNGREFPQTSMES